MAYFNGNSIPGLGANISLAPVDKKYNPESDNAQSGKAVAEAIANASGGGSEYYVEVGMQIGPTNYDWPTEENIISDITNLYSTDYTMPDGRPAYKVTHGPAGEESYVYKEVSQNSGGGNIRSGTGLSSLQQIQDSKYTGVAIVTKNPNAASLDSTLTDNEPIGATGEFAAAFGGTSSAQGKRSFAAGTNCIAKGKYSFAMGDNCVALGNDSFAHGNRTTTFGMASTAGGFNTVAIGDYSDAGGHSTEAIGKASVSRGYMAKAIGDYSFATGANTIAIGENQTVVGQFNIEDKNALFIVGNGTDAYNRSNAFAVYKDGSIKIGNTTVTEEQLRKLLALIG